MYKKGRVSFRITSLLLAMLLAGMSVMPVSAEEGSGKSAKALDREETEETEAAVATLEDARVTLAAYEDAETEWEEITIDSIEDLKEFSRNCWLDTWSQNKKVYLEADLDLAGSDFTPIPTFGGYFDGQGHTISGLFIRDAVSYTGLFSYTQRSAVIVGLNVKGSVKPFGKQMIVGGIVGDNSGIIFNCRFDGIVEGNDYVGGIVGFNEISGVILDCSSNGKVTGAHYTGGIVGDNTGNVAVCVNDADVNISGEEQEKSLEDLNELTQYTSGLLDAGESGQTSEKEAAVNSNTIDSGGIAGLSTGIIQFCKNNGDIGYEHIGYNAGGIVGRQSGYVYGCENTGTVCGRKDVGGITGQTEPFIAIDLSKDIAYQLAENIDIMHDLTDRMLDDAGSESDVIAGRLSIIQDFADKALDDTSYLADKTVEWTDGMVGSVNEAINRLDYVMDETAKQNGMLDQTREAAGNVKNAAYELEDTVEALDIYQYMTQEEREKYDNAKAEMDEASRQYADDYAKAVKAYEHYYIDTIRKNAPYTGGDCNEDDLRPLVGGVVQASWAGGSNYSAYLDVEGWVHYDAAADTQSSFPASEGEQATLDNDLLSDVAAEISDNASDIDTAASAYADAQYRITHGGTTGYTDGMRDYLETMSDIVLAHQSQMTEGAVNELKDAVGYTQDASGNLQAAGNEAKNIADTLNGMPDIEMPLLGDGYRSKTNSLTSNLQGLSENIGYLNGEMSTTNDVLLADLEELNNQFSTIMRLYTDAIDGVLDMDYSNIYEDNSEEDAETSTDATIAECDNSGTVRGDINIAGIAGTMAIEYDFDLESDVTGIEDAKLNSTFLTKCVLRGNVNSGKITAQKNCAGGISGLQEMGTILWCENYGKIVSSTGSYVGGITGESRSHINKSYAKCSLSGDEYVAGIAGYASSITDCCAMVRVQEATAFYGAIAGKTDEEGEIAGNFFVSEEIAGIDRISYSGKAEPLAYKDMLDVEGLPEKFRMMTISFYADEEEVETLECPYGGMVSSGMYPDIPVKEGFYADWNIKELRNVTQDEDVTVEYVRYLTTIASGEMRANAQSVLLVDGMFEKEAVLEVSGLAADNDVSGESGSGDSGLSGIASGDIVERWQVSFTGDGNREHQFRYQAPQGETEDVSIYVKTGDTWVKADTELMGIYHLFSAEGTDLEIMACVHVKGIMDYMVYIITGTVVLAAVVILIVMKVRKKKKAKRKAAAESEEKEE
ncbi:MAG: hypothetical protein NC314_02920 [Roseburia sp.]|nr:hypothetical protein [Roseburia sp.]MCM1241768.1 hypothetical protein [Roseburia sp.]